MRKSIIILLLALSACTSYSGTSVPVKAIPDPRYAYLGGMGETSVSVSILDFSDIRSQMTPTYGKGDRVDASGDVAAVVRDGFMRELAQSGVRITVKSGGTIRGEVREWVAYVREHFPLSHVETEATIVINVLGPDLRMIYSGTYTGKTSGDYPLLSDDKIQSILGEAMAGAIDEAVNDERLRTKLIDISLGYSQ